MRIQPDTIAVYPSALSVDFSRLFDQIRAVERGGADGIHLDVMDGHFVPNITFGPVVIRWIRQITRLPCLAHLMIERPDRFIPAFHEIGMNAITIHPETGLDIHALIDMIHTRGMEAGLALNPETDASVIAPFLDRIERVLVMTVHPGFGGQTFLTDQLNKIQKLRRMAEEAGTPLRIDVDGGIDVHTAPWVVKAGARGLVAGTAIFEQKNPESAVRALRRSAEAAL